MLILTTFDLVVFKKLFALSEIYPRLIRIWIGPKLHVAVFDPRDAEVILRASRQIVRKADEYYFLQPWLGESLLTLSGPKFKNHKRLILPAFSMNILKNFVEVFNKHSKELVKALKTEERKEEFDIHDYLSSEAMNVFLETSLGANSKTLGEKAKDYAHAVEKLCKIVLIRTYKVWLRPDIFFYFSSLKKQQDKYIKIVHELTEYIIQKRKKEYVQNEQNKKETGEEENKQKRAFLDLLLETSLAGDGLNDKEIKDEVLTFMFAGQDTTAGTTGFALSLLGLYRYHQAVIYNELFEIFGDSDRDATYEDLNKMEYMERVILETLRLYPTVPMIGKKLNDKLELDGGYILPKNSTIGLMIMKIQRNPAFFNNPHVFDPDNFLPERIKKRHPYSFIPFSAGARTCLGPKYAMLKLKVSLSHILRNYKVYSTRREADFILSGQTTLKRVEGFLLRIEPRKRVPIEINNNRLMEKDSQIEEALKEFQIKSNHASNVMIDSYLAKEKEKVR